ncbi:hypothetical protein D9615_008858 [Tricholomella constricta]|uniref:Fe2OG dioxygenase domain-containing protein n=1 Tax=Tricholomella constricta TaxID=117010 RepID=A0A8H5LYF4_9AGAR|nr:hypothetical protein D9615_008858 [Tricholomella constricta]
MATQEILAALEDAIYRQPPFCTGTIPVSSRDTTLFYKQGESASWLDLSQATEDQLQALADACEPATFGLGQRDVLDETYRKAGKMDSDKFLTSLDVDKLGIVARVHVQLLEGDDVEKTVNAELYKLNVYEKDSFFKTHKDTPRGDTMFASLVVAFPTPYEGGALVLRHNDEEWTFDSAALTREQAKPSIAYIAFFSDVDHEVAVVTSGHRVTLTYNLYLEDTPLREKLPASIKPVAADDSVFHTALSKALDDPSFLPNGGYLGFGLSFKYPIGLVEGRAAKHVLKGSDAMIFRVCQSLSVRPRLSAVYEVEELRVLVSAYYLVDNREYEEGIFQTLLWEFHGKIVLNFEEDIPLNPDTRTRLEREECIRMEWVTPLTTYSHFCSDYIAHGNEASAECIYADLCISAEVGPFGRRHEKCPSE